MVRGFNLLFHVMPIGINLWIGRRCGALAYLLSGKRGRVTYANIKAAFGKEKTPAEIKAITKKVYVHIGQTFAELMSLTKVNAKYIDKYVTIRNIERVDKASKNPKGMIFCSAHFGNWELSTMASAIIGYPMYMLARDQKMKRLNELFIRLRESKGTVVIRKGMNIKTFFRVLREGKSIGLLADQNAGSGGELVDFFGRPASTAVGPYRFAQKSGAWVLPAFIHRVKGPYHELIIEEPMVVGKDDDIGPYMLKYNRLLEKHVRAYPEQWFWVHKRWKRTSVKYVMVLDDGKKGHLKQSLAAVKQIGIYRREEGYLPEDLKVDTVRVRFRSRAHRAAFNAASPFFGARCQGCLNCLKACLDDESYAAVSGRYADVIVSCGSALAAVNRLLKIENNARNLTVLDPGRPFRSRDNVIVIPRHDARPDMEKRENVAVTDLAPNLIDPEVISVWREKAPDYGDPGIGLLFGGDNAYFLFSDERTKAVAEGMKKASEYTGRRLFVTTSRRTPLSSENVLKEVLGALEEKMKFIPGAEDDDENTVEKLMAASGVVIVSGESISMVSEAVASGRPVLVFMPEKRTGRYTKYERFLDGLSKKGYIKLVEPEDIPAAAAAALEGLGQPPLPDDDLNIRRKMYRLF